MLVQYPLFLILHSQLAHSDRILDLDFAACLLVVLQSFQCWHNMRHRLRTRSYLAFVCSLIFISICVYMYMILETASLSGGADSSPVDQVD